MRTNRLGKCAGKPLRSNELNAAVGELEDPLDLGSSARKGSVGSTPTCGTKQICLA